MRGLAEIAGHEAIVLSPYRDSVGVWTIGIGHTAAAGPPDPKAGAITLEEALAVFARDIQHFEAEVAAAVKVPVEQHEFDALVSFHFNTGGIRRAELVRRLNAGDREGAAAGFLGWLKPPEIEGRRRAEMMLFRSGIYGSGTATIYNADAAGRIDWRSGRKVDALAALQAAPPIATPPAPETLPDVRAAVRLIQAILNAGGAGLTVDGDYGPRTRAAVAAVLKP